MGRGRGGRRRWCFGGWLLLGGLSGLVASRLVGGLGGGWLSGRREPPRLRGSC
jgi:hypothetical protein